MIYGPRRRALADYWEVKPEDLDGTLAGATTNFMDAFDEFVSEILNVLYIHFR